MPQPHQQRRNHPISIHAKHGESNGHEKLLQHLKAAIRGVVWCGVVWCGVVRVVRVVRVVSFGVACCRLLGLALTVALVHDHIEA